MKPKLSKKQELVLDSLPWVHYYCEPKVCTGWMRSGKKCKNQAHWRFTSKKSRSKWAMNVPNGVYCWSHLISRGIYGSMEEEARTDARWYELAILCQSISPNKRRCVRMNDGHLDHHTQAWVSVGRPEPDPVSQERGYHFDEEWTDQ